MLDEFDRERCEVLAGYVIDCGATVRQAAAHFGISKSTVHKDLSIKLKYVNRGLFNLVSDVLKKNKAERHIRGGEATRIKYLNKKNLST